MEDKDFLSHFWSISQYPNKQLKFSGARNIVQTILTLDSIKNSGNRKLSGGEMTSKITIVKKYANEDFGKNVSPDLNYTLSRLIKGIISSNNASREGFYITFCLVISRFTSIDPISLIKTIVRETTTVEVTGKHEGKCIKCGRILLLSAMRKAKLITRIKEKEEYVKEYIKSLIEFYKGNVWLQSLIAKTLFDFIDSIKDQHNLLEEVLKLLAAFIAITKDKKEYKLPPFSGNSSNLMIVLAIKQIHKLLRKKCHAFLLKQDKKKEIKSFFESAKIDSFALEKYIDFLINSRKANEIGRAHV